MTREELDNMTVVMGKLHAFGLYLKTKDINEVKRVFPEYVHFVKENKGKTLREVRKELTLVTHSPH